jgi:hypothetical protein
VLDQVAPRRLRGLVSNQFPQGLDGQLRIPGLLGLGDELRCEVNAAKLRALYPELREANVLKFKGGPYSEDNGIRTDEAVFSYEGHRDPSRQLRGSTMLMPACGDSSSALDPLLTWWVLLFALSMITRYKPVQWTEIIDVNRSPLAVPLETMLTKALEAVPIQIHATLTNGGRAPA